MVFGEYRSRWSLLADWFCDFVVPLAAADAGADQVGKKEPRFIAQSVQFGVNIRD